ncbi:hypothetical protein VitviT2T_004247 [Vitis vinifera]|uniref:Retrovirus-related Pol polyprotein from transposon TNT 1-94 n=1 Tax=Vitis vinifera TaxID=29760 RepID=A0ABY9BQ32_VITVI|nr:hypothetical protein VitviT2T_004247 [Vitis vinifera]
MFIKTKISYGIRGSVDQHDNVKALLKAINEQFVTSDKALASTLIMKFSSLRLIDVSGVQEHIMKMRDIAAQLKTLEVYTKPDIAFFVGMLGRYQSNPGIDHWKATKKVMRYLQGTKDYMLMYRWTDNLEVIGYSDSDYAGCIDSRKINFKICLYANRWSCFLEKRKANFDCNFHYGG